MKLTKQRQKDTGAFYTPKIRADKAVEYIKKVIPDFTDWCFYDPACWEWALLEALPDNVVKIGTTLEAEDVEICRKKWLRVKQMDFLSADLTKFAPRWILDRTIVFTNPPYVKLPAGQYQELRTKYRTNDTVALFYYRILFELKVPFLAGFNKMDLLQWSSSMEKFGKETGFYERCLECFVSPSMSWGLKWKFPIAFQMVQNFWREDYVQDQMDIERKVRLEVEKRIDEKNQAKKIDNLDSLF